jgi:hypothetical protein
MPDEWERQFGLDPDDRTDASKDPDGDGASNLAEYRAKTHPRGFYRRFFAGGSTRAPFRTEFALLNPTTHSAQLSLRFVTSDGRVVVLPLELGPTRRATVQARDVPGLAETQFAVSIESDRTFAAEREVTWGAPVYGSDSDSGSSSLSSVWYLAEGTTRAGYDSFIELMNPAAASCYVDVTYLLPAPKLPIVKRYALSANSRRTIWINGEGAALSGTDVAAIVKTTNGQPIAVERSMYYSTSTKKYIAGVEGTGSRTLSTRWHFAEGRTGSLFDTYLLIGNASATSPALVHATYLLPTGATVSKDYQIAPHSRRTILVDAESAALASTIFSVSLASQNGVPVFAERTVAWPGGTGGWREAHNSPGSTRTGVNWVLADGESGGPDNAETIVRIANTSNVNGPVRVRLYFEDGTASEKTYSLRARSTFAVPINTEFPEAAHRVYGVQVVSTGSTPLALVVESVLYRGSSHEAGSSSMGTKLR